MKRYRYQKTNYGSYVFILLIGVLIGLGISLIFYYEAPETKNHIISQKPVIPLYADTNCKRCCKKYNKDKCR